MKISIITATYNSGATLRDTLESVLSQDYIDIEHVIKDGLSSDDTLDIVESYRTRYDARGYQLKVISDRDKGLYDAMNIGIAASTGDVIGILNSDDFYASSSVLSLIAGAIGNNYDCCYGDLVFITPENSNKIVRTWKGSQYTPGAFLNGWHPAHPTFYARKELFEKLSGFDTSFNVSADFELMLRFIEKGHARSLYIPHTMVKMRMGGESTGSLRKIIEGNKNVLRAFKKNGFEVPNFYLIRRFAPKVINMIRNKLGL